MQVNDKDTVLIVNSEKVLHIVVVFLFLSLSK